MLTIIGKKDLATIISLSGQAIRDFLETADPSQFKGEAVKAITSFQSNPLSFSEDKLISYGADTVTAINYPVRIEVRGVTTDGAAQVVAKGIWGERRFQAAAEIAQQCQQQKIPVQLKLAGSSSMEFNILGVDKSLPIHFLQGAFDLVLDEMQYQPGRFIDSRKTKTVIAADGDGTIYDGPRIGVLPGLAESPVKEAMITYLKAGGIFMLISGNDMNRVVRRIVGALPAEVYCRILVAANGGADLVYINAQGQSVPVTIYKNKALDFVSDQSSKEVLDIVYLGDDPSSDGNDYPAFLAVGAPNAVCVQSLQETAEYFKKYLSNRHIFS